MKKPFLHLTLAFLAASLLLGRAYKDSVTLYSVGDDDFYWSFPRSLVYDGDLDFRNEPLPTFEQNPAVINFASPFPGLLWTPAVLVGKWLTPLMKILPSHPMGSLENGTSMYHRLLVSAFSALLTLLGLWFLYAAISQKLPSDSAFLGVLVMFLSSPLVYFTFRRPLMSHSSELFTLGAFAFWSLRFFKARRMSAAFWTGLCAGLAMGVRYPNVFVVLAWVFGLWWVEPKAFPCGGRGWGCVLLGLLVPILIQLIIWKQVRGTWIPQTGQYSFKPGDLLSHFLLARETLAGLWNIFGGAGWGLLWLESPVLMALWMTMTEKSQAARWMRALGIGLLPLLLIAANFGSQGGSYGYRYLLAKGPWVALGSGLFFERYAKFPRTRAAWVLACLLIPCLALLLFESGPSSLTLQPREDWVNDRYVSNVLKTLAADPRQVIYALSGCPLGHVMVVALSRFTDFHFLPEAARAKALARLGTVPLTGLLWYLGGVWTWSLAGLWAWDRFWKRSAF